MEKIQPRRHIARRIRGANASAYALTLGLIGVIALAAVGSAGTAMNQLLSRTGNVLADAGNGIGPAVNLGPTSPPPPPPPATISITPASVSQAEGNSGTSNFNYTATRSGSAASADTVSWSVSAATANAADFVGNVVPSGQVVIPAGGGQSVTIAVPVQGDTTVEPNETFTISLTGTSGPSVLGSILTSSGTISNDDTSITISGSGTSGSPWSWSDGSVAARCALYLTGQAPGGYTGVAQSSGSDGVYLIDPDGGSTSNAYSVHCDMGNGGWMLVMKARTQGYSDAIWTGTSSINLSDCLSTTAPNDTNCKNGPLFTWTGWTSMRGENRGASVFATIPPLRSGESLLQHFTGAASTDSNVQSFTRTLFPRNNTPGNGAYGWNRTGYCCGRDSQTYRMVNDGNGWDGFFIGSNSTAGACGLSHVGISDCGALVTVWFWLR